MPSVSILGPIQSRMDHQDTTPIVETQQSNGIPSLLLGHSAAGFSLVLSGYLLAYMIRFEALLGYWSTPFVLTVVVAVMVMVLLSVRQEEGRLKFGRAFGLSLLAGFLVRLGYNSFMLLLFHVMRPDLVDAYVDLVLQKTEEAMSAFNVGDVSGQWEDMVQMIEVSTRSSLTVGGQMADAFTGLVWLAFVAAVVSLILKRNPDKAEGFQG